MSARFALLALLVLPSVATAEPVSPGLARRLEEKCATCHDADHPTLNLETALPPVDDHAAWTRILDAVETYRMPPAAPGGSRMDPAIRQEILDDVGRILGHDADGPVEPRYLHVWAWRQVVMRLATRVLPADQSWTLVAPELVDASPANPQFAVAALMLETRSAKVCDAIARADAARPAATRVFLKGSADAQVRTLIPSLFGGAATPADLRAARQFLRDLAAPTPTDGWIGLCTLYLSGPRLRHLSYVRGS